MRTLIISIFTCCCLLVQPAFAGPSGHGHSHGPVTEAVAVQNSDKAVASMAKAGVIDPSWVGIKHSAVEQKNFGQGPEWVVKYDNDQIEDAAKRSLYVFFTLDGQYLAANYTGQ